MKRRDNAPILKYVYGNVIEKLLIDKNYNKTIDWFENTLQLIKNNKFSMKYFYNYNYTKFKQEDSFNIDLIILITFIKKKHVASLEMRRNYFIKFLNMTFFVHNKK